MLLPDPKFLLAVLLALIVSTLGSCQYGKHLQKQADDLDTQKTISLGLKAQSDRLVFLQNKLGVALNENAELRQKNSADAAAARSSVTGLQRQLDSARARLRANPASASNQYALALSDVFESCTVEYQRLAEQADGHAADVKLLENSWPK